MRKLSWKFVPESGKSQPAFPPFRYSTSSLSYTIPLSGEGKYLLVLKFAEVFFEAAHQKVFDVLLNDVHPVVSDLDIFSLVGHATAHDEYISFSVSRGKLFVRDRVSDVRGGRLKVTFAKGQYDNPKVNAILLLKGVDVNEFPRLPPLSETTRKRAPPRSATKTTTSQFIEESENNFLNDEEQEEQQEEQRKPRRTSGPKQPDPYEGMDSWMITIGFIVVATIIPVVILRCRL